MLSSVALWGARDFVAPKASNASAYPCKDTHPTEHITAAVDVYNSSPKADIFITHFSDEGILPVFLIITNDGDQPIAVNNMQAELVTARRSKLEALDVDDVLRRVAHIKGNSTNPNPHAGPIPLPGGATRTRRRNSSMRKSRARSLRLRRSSRIPRSRASCSSTCWGCSQPVDGAHIYLTGIREQ